jgi:hypothetical protein
MFTDISCSKHNVTVRLPAIIPCIVPMLPNLTQIVCSALWIAIEGLFWVFQTFRYHKLNCAVQNPPTDDVQGRIEQFCTLAGVLDMKEFLSGWFMNVPFELLTREHVLVRLLQSASPLVQESSSFLDCMNCAQHGGNLPQVIRISTGRLQAAQ